MGRHVLPFDVESRIGFALQRALAEMPDGYVQRAPTSLKFSE
jgi:hypothetical protein